MKKWLIVGLMLVCSSSFVSTQTIEAAIKNKYPNTKIDSIVESPIKGFYEVTMGKNIAYTNADARYFLFGHIFDMQTQQDLTAERKKDLEKVDWQALNLKNAVVEKKGDGSRVFGVITDIDCTYCQMLEKELATMTNYTAYKFLTPMRGGEVDSVSIWCATDQNKAFKDRIIDGKTPVAKTCTNPIQTNLAMAEKLGVTGTPMLFKPDGTVQYGYAEKAEIEEFLK